MGTDFFRSPPWNKQFKRQAAAALLILGLIGLYFVRAILIPLIMAMVVAYVVKPGVDFFHKRLRLPRAASIGVVYLTIIALLITGPLIAIPQIVREFNNFLNNTPRYIQELTVLVSQPIRVGEFEVSLDQIPALDQSLDNLSDNLVEIVRTVGSQGFTIFGNVASATLSTVTWIIIILFLSFYMVKDYRELFGAAVDLVPSAYQRDMYLLAYEISATWNAFLRGQLTLALIVFSLIYIMALIVGLPNAFLLALIAGLLEFVPTLGPILSAVPGVLVALFQSNSSWLGSQMSPIWYALIVLGMYIVIQQLEGWLLIPKVIGRSLNLHPMIVFVAVIAGASVAGILGILLASPVLASGRLVFMYMYRKLTDQPPFPNKRLTPELEAALPEGRLLRVALAAGHTDGVEQVDEEE
jgi:predicted PurR-regulated permease PerM